MGDATSADNFRELAKAYAALHQEITDANKSLRELKKQKDGIGENIIMFMKANMLDECQLPDGSKITRKLSKRTGILKKELILEELVALVGGDEAKATNHLNNIMSKREIVEKDVISCNLSKSRT